MKLKRVVFLLEKIFISARARSQPGERKGFIRKREETVSGGNIGLERNQRRHVYGVEKRREDERRSRERRGEKEGL